MVAANTSTTPSGKSPSETTWRSATRATQGRRSRPRVGAAGGGAGAARAPLCRRSSAELPSCRRGAGGAVHGAHGHVDPRRTRCRDLFTSSPREGRRRAASRRQSRDDSSRRHAHKVTAVQERSPHARKLVAGVLARSRFAPGCAAEALLSRTFVAPWGLLGSSVLCCSASSSVTAAGSATDSSSMSPGTGRPQLRARAWDAWSRLGPSGCQLRGSSSDLGGRISKGAGADSAQEGGRETGHPLEVGGLLGLLAATSGRGRPRRWRASCGRRSAWARGP